MSTKSYLVIVVMYLLCGVCSYIGASRLLSRRIKKQVAQRVGMLVSLALTLAGLFLMTWAYLYM
jgi:hypothetical protein